jgi:nicotinamidase-related amidase
MDYASDEGAMPGGWFAGSAAQPRLSGAQLRESPRVLLLVDWINTFDHGEAEQLEGPALEAAQRTARLKQRLGEEAVQAIYANDNYGIWRSDFRELLKTCAERGGPAARIAELLAPDAQDIAVLKPRHSAFYQTPLQLLLQQLKARELVIAGLATEWCVLFTAMDAYVRGYSLWIPADCVASHSSERHSAAIEYVQNVLGANVSAGVPA